ncbi:hypothetical protein ACKWTF_000725 [Chironomus riparius]
MSVAISKIIIFLLLIIATVYGLKQKTLNELFEEFKELRQNLLDDYEVGEYFGRYNETCMSHHLKISKFGNKTINEVEEQILLDSALFICSESDAFKAGKLIQTRLMKTYKLDEDENFINCLKSKLLELDPSTKLVNIEDRKKLSTCTNQFQNLFPEHLKDFINTINEHIFNTTCGKVSIDDHTKTYIKSFLVCSEDLSPADRNIEERQLLKELKFNVMSGYNCLMAKFSRM